MTDMTKMELNRAKTLNYYLTVFTLISILGFALISLIAYKFGLTRASGPAFILVWFAASITSGQFLQYEHRHPNRQERKKLINRSYIIVILINFIAVAAALIASFSNQETFRLFLKDYFSVIGPVVAVVFVLVILVILMAAYYMFLRIGYKKAPPNNNEQINDKATPENLKINPSLTPNSLSDNPSDKKEMFDTALPIETHNNEWRAPHERAEREGFAVRNERAPIGRWLVSVIILGLVIAGALWLASKVVVPRDIPYQPPGQVEVDDEPAPKVGADDAAWVKALEKDTLEGYREYLEGFPDGNHADDAQAEIDAYDNRAWATAEQRDTIAGYEDYLETWPEGLHTSKARERINEMKAAAEAARKDAAERAAQEARDWQSAAQTNTIESYRGYLTKHSGGKNAPEAQARIDRMQASAADTAAWNAAKNANTTSAYQLYLSSFPQGSYAAQAIAAMEALRPAVGRSFRDCVSCPTMVSLPSGTASLGAGDAEADARPNEKPQRPVTFANMFAMSVTEVTFAEYDACIAAGGCSGRPNDNGWGRGNRPVINVSWEDAQKYASWLSSKSGHSYALPTEAQWEYAARAGDSKAIIGGSPAAICAFANGAGVESGLKWANGACTDPAADRTLPAGTLGANKFGIKDMIGNAAEWTQDCNTLNLRDAPTDGSADQRGSCNQRVTRGGSWFSGPSDLRYAARLMQRRGDSNDFTGFRVVRKVSG